MKSLHSQREWLLILFRHAIWSFLSTAPMYLQQDAKLEYPGRQNIHAKLCEKKPGAHLPGAVNHKLWRGQLCDPVPHTPVHSGCSPQVMVVAPEVNGLVVHTDLPGTRICTGHVQSASC